ncbi:hypothetical protein DPMN_164506 [Dreissena polymorpha]|uniref:Uncharacterized protein n=1 Tax=Dreissena polymorpha TaxID=45954 RepID=A0A9D4ET28_DREPO|nr:hypothetical protein DPMN_164506 [Dreissena polymorpha]
MMTFYPALSLSATGSAVTVTEQLAPKREIGRISKATFRVDLRLPSGSATMNVFQSLKPKYFSFSIAMEIP